MIRNKYAVLAASFASLGLLGALLSSIGATLPAVQEHFRISIAQAGRVTATFQFSYALLCFFGGVLTDFLGKNRVLTAGGLVYGVCTLLMGVSPLFSTNLTLFALAGIGGGLLFIGSNTMVVQLFPQRRGTYLNLLHLCFAVASVLAPLLASALLSAGRGWSAVYRVLGLVALAVGTLFLFTRAGAPSSMLTASALRRLLGSYRRMLGDRRFLAVGVSHTLAVGTQFATIYLMVLFLTRTRGMPAPAARQLLALYFVLLAAGRLACSALIRRLPVTRLLLALLGLLAASLAGAWLTRGPVSSVCFALSGLAASGVMPSLLALASHLLPAEIGGSALGLLALFSGVGGMALTWLTTWVAEAIGLDLAFLLVVLVAFLALGYFAAVRGRLRAEDGFGAQPAGGQVPPARA